MDFPSHLHLIFEHMVPIYRTFLDILLKDINIYLLIS